MERQKRLVVMMVLTGLYFFVELIVGRITNCVSLTADAFHVMSDCMALGVTFASIKAADRKPTDRYTYGLRRAELVGGMINSIFLLSICFTLITEGIHRLFEREEIKQPKVVISTASVGLVINLVGMFIFKEHSHLGGECSHSHSHPHGHGHSHGHHEHGKDGSLNQKALFLHIAGDAMASLAVIIAGVISWKATDWEGRHVVDPILSIIISLILTNSALPLAFRTCDIMLQRSPIADTTTLKNELLAVPGVSSILSLHIWSLTESTVIGTCSVEVVKHLPVRILQQVFEIHGLSEVTVEQHVAGQTSECVNIQDLIKEVGEDVTETTDSVVLETDIELESRIQILDPDEMKTELLLE
eukprot:TRINITY_DN17152_c0_g1_i5.p1 TRINITY_DN17152_c0_g1~~TRINITY_DN17152_c0_g1_i5.p1  ORF type:complete len:358 (+),score=45.15 TRINITY_DN17152_c0_g1_i5:1680-2753(+)